MLTCSHTYAAWRGGLQHTRTCNDLRPYFHLPWLVLNICWQEIPYEFVDAAAIIGTRNYSVGRGEDHYSNLWGNKTGNMRI